jgi:hypothetical protein
MSLRGCASFRRIRSMSAGCRACRSTLGSPPLWVCDLRVRFCWRQLPILGLDIRPTRSRCNERCMAWRCVAATVALLHLCAGRCSVYLSLWLTLTLSLSAMVVHSRALPLYVPQQPLSLSLSLSVWCDRSHVPSQSLPVALSVFVERSLSRCLSFSLSLCRSGACALSLCHSHTLSLSHRAEENCST